MRIAIKREFVWSVAQSRYILVRDLSINRTGLVLLMKGATPGQNDLAASQSNFYTALTNDYNTQFAGQSAILGSLTGALSPIVNAGPNQFGFSPGETNSLNSQAIQGTGQQFAGASQNLKEQQAAAGGGNALLPSGVNSQQQQNLASAGANQTSSQLLGIQQAGYEKGSSNFNNAVGALSGAAQIYNPTGFSNSATGAGNAAGTSFNQIAQESQAADPFNAILGAAGGAANAYLGGL